MVIRLVGNIDGKEIVLEWVEGDWWEIAIPPPKSGTYIADFTAYDDAGNVAYCTKILVTFHLEDLCLRLEPYPYDAKAERPVWETKVLTSYYYAELVRRAECRRY